MVRHLDLVLPTPAGGRGTVSGGAIAQARTRLGPEPLAALFRQTADTWATHAADDDRWHGLAVYGVDGTTLRVADTPENSAAFGRPGVGTAKEAAIRNCGSSRSWRRAPTCSRASRWDRIARAN